MRKCKVVLSLGVLFTMFLGNAASYGKTESLDKKNYISITEDVLFSKSLLEINKLCDIPANTKVFFSTLEVRSDRVAWLYKVNAGEKCKFDSGYILADKLEDANVAIMVQGKKQVLGKFPKSFGEDFRPGSSESEPSENSYSGEREQRIANYSSAKAQRFIRRVKSRVVGFVGKCWKHVNDAITGVGGRRMGMSAMEFFRTTSNQTMRKSFGLCKLVRSNGKLETKVGNAPLGSIIGYRPGQNGFHGKWGHGEIKVSNSRYCSDGCATRSGNFRAAYILYPCN